MTSFMLAAALPLVAPAAARAQVPYPFPVVFDTATANVRSIVKPRDAAIYVDGYYSGVVDDFDGVFQRLHLPAGQHEFVLYLQGYRTVHQSIYLSPNTTYKLRYEMERLGAGESAEAPPAPAPQSAGPAAGSALQPPPGRGPRDAPAPNATRAPDAPGFGTLLIRVQPAGAEVTIDGELWQGPEGDERLLVQVAEGTHRLEIRKAGFRPYSTAVHIGAGETVPVNVSLSAEGGAR
jgi:hypothetical protein